MNETLARIKQIRSLLVDARVRHRAAQDDLRRVERAERRAALARLTAASALERNAEARKQQLVDEVEESEAYRRAFAQMRAAESRAEAVQANLENAMMEVRQDEWLVRDKLADAIMEYATRPCGGVRDHAIGDTLVDATGEDGVHAGESNYVRGMTRIA